MTQRHCGESNMTSMTNAWASFASNFVQGATAANQAAVTAMLTPFDSFVRHDSGTVAPPIPSLQHGHVDWTFDRTGDDPSTLSVGDLVTFEKTITEEDVRRFAEVSGDTNRLHLDEAFASDTRFGERIAHGTLVSGLISAALARLPGLTVYLSQDLQFRAPVSIGDRVSARVEIVEDLGGNQYRLETVIRDEENDVTVIDGEAVVLIDSMPDA